MKGNMALRRMLKDMAKCRENGSKLNDEGRG